MTKQKKGKESESVVEVDVPVAASVDAATTDQAVREVRGRVLAVRALVDSFRRAGYSFGRETTEIPLADLSQAQFDALMAEPQLHVEAVGLSDLDE